MGLNTLIFFVTSRCNARCDTCFYWQDLNQSGDLSVDEISTLSRAMPPFRELWLSGGEPMMRQRLDEIIKLFVDRNGIDTLNLPTNGLFPDQTVDLMSFLTEEAPQLDVNLNVALDGFAPTHDRIRGVPGNFDRTVATLEALYPVRARNPRIRLHINSVVTTKNINELEDLGWWLIDQMDLNGHYFQIIRGDPKDEKLARVDRSQLTSFYGRVKPIHEFYGQKLADRHGGSLKGWLKKLYYTQTLYFHYTVQERNYEGSTSWPMKCSAGETILVIDYNGDVRACELRGKLMNLRDVDCDFTRVFPSPEVRRETRQITEDGCWCTHVCFIHDSLKSSRRVKFYDIPLGQKVV